MADAAQIDASQLSLATVLATQAALAERSLWMCRDLEAMHGVERGRAASQVCVQPLRFPEPHRLRPNRRLVLVPQDPQDTPRSVQDRESGGSQDGTRHER